MNVKKIFGSVLCVLVLTTQVYSEIPDHYHYFSRLECEVRPIKRKPRIKNAPPLIKVREGTSSNWSGYAIETNFSNPTLGSVSDVSGSWTVPKLSSTSGNRYASIWVGIDGYESTTVEQIGTEHDWISGLQQNYAWFEMYPRNAYEIVGFPCTPGDKISAEVTFTGSGIYQMTIYNATKNVSFQIPTNLTKLKGAHRTSAEWIVEAPSTSSVLPLSKFGTVTFTNCSATVNGIKGSISNSNWQNDPITMETTGGIVKAQPSGLSPDGTSFSVTWNHK